MAIFNYTSGFLPIIAGNYPNATVTEASVQPDGRLKIGFTLPDERIFRTWIRPELSDRVFLALLEASGGNVIDTGGQYDTDFFYGVKGELVLIEREGKGQYEGKKFINAVDFIPVRDSIVASVGTKTGKTMTEEFKEVFENEIKKNLQ